MLQGSTSQLEPTSSVLSQLHSCPALLSLGTHSKYKYYWMFQAASVSVPDTLTPRFCLSWLLAPFALSLRREVLVEFCLLAPHPSPYMSLTLYMSWIIDWLFFFFSIWLHLYSNLQKFLETPRFQMQACSSHQEFERNN